MEITGGSIREAWDLRRCDVVDLLFSVTRIGPDLTCLAASSENLVLAENHPSLLSKRARHIRECGRPCDALDLALGLAWLHVRPPGVGKLDDCVPSIPSCYSEFTKGCVGSSESQVSQTGASPSFAATVMHHPPAQWAPTPSSVTKTEDV